MADNTPHDNVSYTTDYQCCMLLCLAVTDSGSVQEPDLQKKILGKFLSLA